LHKSAKPPGDGLKIDYTITHSRRRRAGEWHDLDYHPANINIGSATAFYVFSQLRQ
jgi:hypothetical protein